MDDKESKVEVDLEQISKTPLKAKGTTNSAKKTKKKTGKTSTSGTGKKKKATFAKMVGKTRLRKRNQLQDLRGRLHSESRQGEGHQRRL
jgi:hypothetical protein